MMRASFLLLLLPQRSFQRSAFSFMAVGYWPLAIGKNGDIGEIGTRNAGF